MIVIRRASELGEKARLPISKIFMNGFGQHFRFFSNDERILPQAFAHMFNLKVFSVALIDEKIVGIGACTNGIEKSVVPKLLPLIKHLGFIKGVIAYIVVGKYFNKPARKVGDGIASLEFFATDAHYRGKGIASSLIKSFLDKDFEEFILEVADTNANAVSLYKKLGFEEFDKEKEKHEEKSGISYLLHLSFRKK